MPQKTQWHITLSDEEIERLLAWGKQRSLSERSQILRAAVRAGALGTLSDADPQRGGLRDPRPRPGQTIRTKVEVRLPEGRALRPGTLGVVQRRLRNAKGVEVVFGDGIYAFLKYSEVELADDEKK